MPDLSQNVEAILREVARSVVMPSFKKLAADDVVEKSSGELVTKVDRLSESFIASALTRLIACPVIGEEAASAEPSLLNGPRYEQLWLIDPLDGTNNFVAGRPAFSIMVALLQRGNAVRSWMFNPVAETMDIAELGGGAHRNGERVHCRQKSHATKDLAAVIKTRFLPGPLKAEIEVRSARLGRVVPGSDCAGIDASSMYVGAHDRVTCRVGSGDAGGSGAGRTARIGRGLRVDRVAMLRFGPGAGGPARRGTGRRRHDQSGPGAPGVGSRHSADLLKAPRHLLARPSIPAFRSSFLLGMTISNSDSTLV